MVGVVFRRELPMGFLCALRSVAQHGEVPDRGDEPTGHRDGWGLVSFRGGSPRYIGRSERPLHLDPSYDAALDDVVRLEGPNIVIAHARRGSEGSRSLVNTHPFVGEGIVFAHNGTVKGFQPKTTRNAKGQTDSERLFMALLDRRDEKKDIGAAVKSLILEDVRGHEYTAVTLLVSDGRELLGYRGYSDEKDAWYYQMNMSRCQDDVTLFQETVQEHPGDVSHLQNGELVRISLGLDVSSERIL